jgi:crotonobetainyl-CoA:carnitine CoA-transferase CaiB-like acyl-CoA transferase
MNGASTFLAGTKVLDMSIWRPGPYATSLLVALGADVLKVEPPGGDPMRYYTGLFDEINAGKRSIVLDLKDEADRARAIELAQQADVVVEGFRPGVMARLGFGDPDVRATNPRVVYCSISGYGQEGARASLPGHDVNYQALGGALSPEGGAGAMPRLPAADLASGVTAAFGICAALLGRASSGLGAYLDVSMTDVMSTWTGRTGATTGTSAASPSEAQAVPGYGLFATADERQISLGVVNEQHFWSRLCQEVGLDDLADLDFDTRSGRGDQLQKEVAAAIAGRERDDLVTVLTAAGVPVAPVLDRSEMVAMSPFPPFPIRLGLPERPGSVPALDEHHGQGFRV